MAGILGDARALAQIVIAINADDGTVKSGWPVNVSTAASFDHKLHNQRSALSLVDGILYVPYGGYNGDCGDYRGRVVTINTGNPTMVGQWQASGMGDGIWASGGMASDGNGVFAVTGNRTALQHRGDAWGQRGGRPHHRDGDEGRLLLPDQLAGDGPGDLDFGAVNPMVITVPGATPSKLVVAIAKDGKGYLLDADSSVERRAGTQPAGKS